MNIGLIGSGGREHALCKKINESNLVNRIFCFPGNAGTAKLAVNIAVNILDIFTPNPSECEKFSDDFSDLSDRGRIYGRGHRDIYNQINNDLNLLDRSLWSLYFE